MAIQVYNMGLDFTKGERTHQSISDFRKKQSETKLANAQANKYRAETDAAAKAAAADASDQEAFRVIYKDNLDVNGKPKQKEMGSAVRTYYMSTGRPDKAAAFKKSQQEEEQKEIANKDAYKARTQTYAKHLINNPNIGTATFIAEEMIKNNNPDGQTIMDEIKKNPNLTSQQLIDFAMPFAPADMQDPNYVNTGGEWTNTNINSPVPRVPITQSAASKATEVTADKNRTSREVIAAQTSENYQLRTDQMYELKKQKLEEQAIKGKKADRKEADKIKFRLRSGRNALKALDRLYLNAEQNPSAINSIFSNIISGVDRVLGSYKPGLNQEGAPLARFEADTALVAALSADLLGGRINSKFGQERLEKALGAALTGDINNTRDQLDIMTSIIAEETGLPLPPAVLERLIKTGDYDTQGKYIGVWSNEEEVSDDKSKAVTPEMIKADYEHYKELLLKDSNEQ
jgi:hypothetical protein